MKSISGLPVRSLSAYPSSRSVASLQLLMRPSGVVTSTESLKLLSTVSR